MRSATLCLLVLSLAFGAARAETEADRWNLADLYASQAAWDADAAKLEAQLPALTACKGELAKSAERLRECLDLRADMAKRSGRLYVFASEQHDEDTGVAANEAVVQRAELLYNR
ncbi:MAG: oligoendopeptidase F, partial [Burkholderiales bacterium]